MGEVVSKRLVEREMPAALAAGLDDVFAGASLVPAATVAQFLNMSAAKLARLGDMGCIRFQRKGYSWRYYAREDVEAYLVSKPPEMRVQPPPALKNVVCIAEARARLRA
jgi:hypothetical protein